MMEKSTSAPMPAANTAPARTEISGDKAARHAPRYTSYPTAPQFSDSVTSDTVSKWLAELPAEPVSVYAHIPFCDTLCWFCACRTQGATKAAPVSRYLQFLKQDIARTGALLPKGVKAARMHWGGGSPTVLSPEEMADLFGWMREAFDFTDDAEIAIEIDPRDMTDARLDAMQAGGLNRASIGVQDFDERVQKAINRMQGREMTRDVIGALRERGVKGVNIDALYGLPFQTETSLGRTLESLIDLAPDRVALYGYAHVPWMARRQRAIPEDALPDVEERIRQADLARKLLTQAGYVPVGIDHFALPSDGLAKAVANGKLHRNFQGYTDDSHATLIGMGASAISRYPQGYAQNEVSTAEYQRQIEAGGLTIAKGIAFSTQDIVRAFVIERIMCDFSFDAKAVVAKFGEEAAAPSIAIANDLIAKAQAGAADGILPTENGFRIAPEALQLTRLHAAAFDEYLPQSGARHSRVI